MSGTYYDHTGRKIDLGQEIGAGGEGPVYVVQGRRQECAKIYYKPTSERHKKVLAMVKNPPTDPTLRSGHRSIAWPLAALYKDSQRTQFAGFVMPLIDRRNFAPLLTYYDPGERSKNFGGAFNWLYLITTAQNIASAVAALHQRDYCIGDIRPENILASPNTVVTLIDCDSFQVKDQSGTVYRCPVGTPEYTAPELQGKVFPSVDRTPQSDCFALTVLIFQLLMEGYHPFTGRWQLAGDAPPLEEKILRGFFPYGRKLREILPPPGAPPFEILHPQLRGLITRCFVSGHKDPLRRPTAREWFDAFRRVRTQIAECSQNKNHRYFNHLTACPWCQITNTTGKDSFPSLTGQQIALADPSLFRVKDSKVAVDACKGLAKAALVTSLLLGFVADFALAPGTPPRTPPQVPHSSQQFSRKKDSTIQFRQNLANGGNGQEKEAANRALQLKLLQHEKEQSATSESEVKSRATSEPSLSPGLYMVVRSTPLLKEPRSKSDVITWLDAETKVNITEATGDYLKVESKRGRAPGYISRQAVRRSATGSRPRP